MSDAIDTMVNERQWAVIGASNAHHKFGRRIFDHLKALGYQVYAVNPNEPNGLDDGSPTYPSVKDLPIVPSVVDVVVPPRFARQVIDDCLEVGVKHVWFQPGAEEMEAIRYAEGRGMTVLWGGPCALIEAKRW
ncbi:CoA-binding protein [bacterium]|nr:CoA-binding protein [bacterium]